MSSEQQVMAPTPRTFTITRHNWYRGHGGVTSRLRNAHGQMCCLGHIALQCGASVSDILGYRTAAEMDISLPEYTRALVVQPGMHTGLAREMMRTNDNTSLSDTERERTLTALAATIGWTLVFVDRPEAGA